MDAMLSYQREPIAGLIANGVGEKGVAQVLRTVRKHLGMDVAFVSRFREDDRVFEHVDADGPASIVEGDAIPLTDGYCLKVVRGELPELIPDTSKVPAAMALPATTAIPIGSHLSVPVQLEGGEVYGTLCCFSYLPDLSLGERDLAMMRAFAEVLAGRIDEERTGVRERAAAADEIRALIAGGAPRIVYQPIYRLSDQALSTVECLSRFDVEPHRPPDAWFDAAHQAGVGMDLELSAIRNALAALDRFPSDVVLGINSSPELIVSERLHPVLAEVDPHRVLLEITEHATVEDYGALADALAAIRARGVRLAIDDAGAGYASMRHILNLKPEVIKLDISLTRDVDTDASRRALARGLIAFAHDIGSRITAEGVETAGELSALRELGADQVQGYHLSRPLPLDDALAAARGTCPAFGAARAHA